jgi:GR25 family glycosyltransferase involved in LPS biosynthesis
MNSIQTFHDIQHIMYINLDKRTDRREKVEWEFTQKLGVPLAKITRFPAIAMTDGAIGCSMSHLKCLEIAKEKGWAHVLIVEDDIEFLQPTVFLQQCSRFFKKHSGDVVLIAGNNMIPYRPVDDSTIQVLNCQTTTGYLVKEDYYDALITNFREGLTLLLKNPHNKQKYAIDKYWQHLQKKDKWYLILPLTVVQRESFSDIEGKITNFKDYMTLVNKAYRT